MPQDLTIARVLHILAVVVWIGGVAMVTSVIIPAVRRMKNKGEMLAMFEELEGRFSLQAKWMTLLAGLTGFYMLYRLDAWDRYLQLRYWWIHAMTLVWLLFTVVIFILEPYVLHAWFQKMGEKAPERTFRIIQRFHWLLLLLSLLTIAGAMAGAHGWFWVN